MMIHKDLIVNDLNIILSEIFWLWKILDLAIGI
jgi:hypothetical protein